MAFPGFAAERLAVMGSISWGGGCYRCGAQGQSSRFCRHCGADLLSMASPAGSTRMRGIRSSFAKGVVTALAGVSILGLGVGTYLAKGSGVQTSGICFANPLGRTSLWPYTASTNVLNLTYHFDANPDRPYTLQYRKAARSAFRAWSRAWPVLRFRSVPSGSFSQIVIRSGEFGTKGKWADHAGLTVPEVDMFGCSLRHALIEINDSYLAHNGALEYPMPMLRHLFVHEIGHSLGLKHVYRQIPSVMIPTSNAYRYVKPQPYDVRTLASLYPSFKYRSLLRDDRLGSLSPGFPRAQTYRLMPVGVNAHN